MALPQSSLSQVCRSIADFVGTALNAQAHSIRIMLGSPIDAVPSSSANEHHINLFFYRLEPAGFFADVAPNEIGLLRLHLLITAFGVVEGQTSAGENDLRLLGEVVRIFHEHPIMSPLGIGGETVQLQVTLQPTGLEDVSHLWGMLGDVSYRPSVIYELSLAPVIPSTRRVGSPLVGMIGLETRATENARHTRFEGTPEAPEVHYQVVSSEREDWAPAISWVIAGQCAHSLSLALGSTELAALVPAVWVAGEEGTPVKLRWQVWDSTQGWRSTGAPQSVTASGIILDPAQVAAATTVNVALPFKDHAGQMMLYAERSYTRGADGTSITIRSNLLLISLYQEAS